MKHRTLRLYESRLALYVVAYNFNGSCYDVLEVARPLSFADNDHLNYKLSQRSFNPHQLDDFMKLNKASLIYSDISCLYGVLRLLNSYYFVIVTKSEKVANIHGNYIYEIKETELVPVVYKLRNTIEESRYKNILSSYSLNNNDFYFSYTYNLTQSLQNNTLSPSVLNLSESQSTESSNLTQNLQERFMWNLNALQPLLQSKCATNQSDITKASATNSEPSIDSFIVPVIHGYITQNTVQLITQQTIKYTLIARRSCLFAGTRYLRRGANSAGDVANEVETEQIVTLENIYSNVTARPYYRSSSLVQIRGSIPLYWSHTNMLVPSPDIQMETNLSHSVSSSPIPGDHVGVETSTEHYITLPRGGRDQDEYISEHRVTPHNQHAAAMLHHYLNLLRRYHGTVFTLNLIRQSESKREELLGREFKKLAILIQDKYHIQHLVDTASHGSPSREMTGKILRIVHNDDNGTDNEEGCNLPAVASIHHGKPVLKYISFDILAAAHKDHTVHLNSNSLHDESGMSDLEFEHEADETCAIDPPISDGSGEGHMFDVLSRIGRAILPKSGFFVQAPVNSAKTDTADSVNYHVFSDVECAPFVRLLLSSHDEITSFHFAEELVESVSVQSPHAADDVPSTTVDGQIELSDHNTSMSNLLDESKVKKVTLDANGEIVVHDYKSTTEGAKHQSSEPSISAETTTIAALSKKMSPESLKEFTALHNTHYIGAGSQTGLLQTGILRTNCIDCLDRTNIAQFNYAKNCIEYQLLALGVQVSRKFLGSLQVLCMESWSEHGDVLANQYGGSGAMHKLENKTTHYHDAEEINPHIATSSNTEDDHTMAHLNKHPKPIHKPVDKKIFSLVGGAQNALVAVQRYYSNISTDFERQQCLDLLLGIYVPFKYTNPNIVVKLAPPEPFVVVNHNKNSIDPPAAAVLTAVSTVPVLAAILNTKQIWDMEQHPSLMRVSQRDLSREKRYLQSVHANYCSASSISDEKGVENRPLQNGVYCDDNLPCNEDITSFEDLKKYPFNECSVDKIEFMPFPTPQQQQILNIAYIAMQANKTSNLNASIVSANKPRLKPAQLDAEDAVSLEQFDKYIAAYSDTSEVQTTPQTKRILNRTVGLVPPSLPDVTEQFKYLTEIGIGSDPKSSGVNITNNIKALTNAEIVRPRKAKNVDRTVGEIKPSTVSPSLSPDLFEFPHYGSVASTVISSAENVVKNANSVQGLKSQSKDDSTITSVVVVPSSIVDAVKDHSSVKPVVPQHNKHQVVKSENSTTTTVRKSDISVEKIDAINGVVKDKERDSDSQDKCIIS